jgi:hypothetical protein
VKIQTKKSTWTPFFPNDSLPEDFLYPFITKNLNLLRKTKSKLEKEASEDEDEDKDLKKDIYVPDKKLTPLKKYFRPYFSPHLHSWEIDYMHSGYFTFGTKTEYPFI